MTGKTPFKVAVIGSGTTGLAAVVALLTTAARVARNAAGGRQIQVWLIAPPGKGLPEDADRLSALLDDVRAIDVWPAAFAALARIGNGRPSDKAADGPEDNRTADYVPRADERIVGFWRDDKREGGVGHPLERYDFRSTTGQLLWSMPSGTYGRELGASPRVLTLRQIHQSLLLTLCGAKPVDPTVTLVQYIASTVKGVEWLADASTVQVTFDATDDLKVCGGKVDEKARTVSFDFDLLVAADGPSAFVHREARIAWGNGQPARRDERRRLFPDTDDARRTTATVVVSGVAGRKGADAAWMPAEKRGWEDVAGDLLRQGQGYVIHGQDLRIGAWRSPEENEKGAVRWSAFVPREVALPVAKGTFGAGHEADAEEAFASRLTAARGGVSDAARKPLVELRDRLRDAFVAFPESVDRLIALTKTQDLAVHVPADRAPDRAHWVAGRIVLLGDSAHPMLPDLGLACTMAFEDAALLAETIERLAYEHDGLPEATPEGDERLGEALAAWRDARFARVAEVVSSSRMAHETVHAPIEAPQWVRDLVVAAMVPPGATYGKENWFTPP